MTDELMIARRVMLAIGNRRQRMRCRFWLFLDWLVWESDLCWIPALLLYLVAVYMWCLATAIR